MDFKSVASRRFPRASSSSRTPSSPRVASRQPPRRSPSPPPPQPHPPSDPPPIDAASSRAETPRTPRETARYGARFASSPARRGPFGAAASTWTRLRPSLPRLWPTRASLRPSPPPSPFAAAQRSWAPSRARPRSTRRMRAVRGRPSDDTDALGCPRPWPIVARVPSARRIARSTARWTKRKVRTPRHLAVDRR